ncbi:hypothetical protein V500_11241 [Pseudogymnoascus sp. VKM F-4518 (FW-2643)]|nr:hypothetical protein V500_11241 [Pseudogymnoascus sp. VKM F-4518 (FW-2643)]
MESDQQQRFFLASFKCIRIPKALFARTARRNYEWGNNGELERIPEDHYSQSLYSHLFGESNDVGKFMQDIEAYGIASLGGKSWSEWFIVQESWRKRTLKYSSPDIAKKNQFTILGLVISVFPDAWSEIAWEEIEAQLWEVVETTCVPFLSVLTTADIEDCLAYSSRQGIFLSLVTILGEKTSPNFRFLIREGICLLRTSGSKALEDVSYLELLQSTVYILSTNNNQPWAARKELMALKTNLSKRSNATIGFALASLPLSWATSRTVVQWFPNEVPSTMEIIAYALLAGTSSIADVLTPSLQNLSLESRVLIAFCEAKRKSFSPAYLLLRESFTELTNSYGWSSMEYLLAGTALVSCFEVEFPQQTFPMIAVADCLLGQSKFNEAREILIRILEYPLVDFNLSNIAICTELRLLKMGRRQRKEPSDFEDWERLRHVFSQFDMATDPIKYECIEELVSFLSVLKPRDKPPQIFEIVKVLNNYHVKEYKGSADSKENLISNIESLQQYKNELNLFTVLGPQLHYCRKMRDRFPHATVDFIERIGAANWHRFQRIKGLIEPVDRMEVTMDTAESKFQDSGLGSSLGSKLSGNQVLDVPQDARSMVSIRSFMETEQGATTLQSMPPEDSAGNRICYICQKALKDVHNESQWKRHAFSDLRPYVCIVEDCKANSIQFASRSEFAAHLTEHQSYKTWRCTKCDTSSQNFDFIQDHVAHSHLPSMSAEQDCQIQELSHVRDLSTQRCPFCNDIPGKANFVGHICHHLEETSLSAIPREEEEFDGDYGEVMSWEGASLGRADKKEMGATAAGEILEESEPEPVTNPGNDEDDWGSAVTIVIPGQDKEIKDVEETEPAPKSVPDPKKTTEDGFSAENDNDGFHSESYRRRPAPMAAFEAEAANAAIGGQYHRDTGEDREVDRRENKLANDTDEIRRSKYPRGGEDAEAATQDYIRRDASRDREEDSRGNKTPKARLETYFVPGTGIDRDVITTDICRYLGNDAIVRPGRHKNAEGEPVQGYFITAYRVLTTENLADIKADSAKWQAERQKYQQSETRHQASEYSHTTQGPKLQKDRYPTYALPWERLNGFLVKRFPGYTFKEMTLREFYIFDVPEPLTMEDHNAIAMLRIY